jgi:peptidylprolyl isomerase
VVAQRGDITLTAADVQALLSHLDAATRDKALHDPATLADLVRTRVMQLAVLKQAADHKWEQTPDVAWRAAQARDAVIIDSYLASQSAPEAGYPSEAEIQAAYDANKSRFLTPRQYHLAQIFLPVPADATPRAEQDIQKKLRDLRAQAAKSPASFADLARVNSQDPATAGLGGELGWVREDQLVPQIRTAVAGLPDGALSDLIRLPDGWHLVRLLGTRPASVPPLADVRDQLVRVMRQQRASQNAQKYLHDMQVQQPVELDQIQLSRLAATPATKP